MTSKQTKRERRKAAQARQRKQRMFMGVVVAVMAIGIGAVVLIGSGDKAAALAPDFELATPDGEAVKLSDYRGQPVALTFMHTF